MKNITVSVPEATYIRARIWAAQRDTSVSAVVAWLLQILPSHKAAIQQFCKPTPPPSPLPRTRTPRPPDSLTP